MSLKKFIAQVEKAITRVAPSTDVSLFRRNLLNTLPPKGRAYIRRLIAGEVIRKPQDELVSVIVPIYNVQAFLNEALWSIVNQDYTNLEIILVNDGSTDNSLEIAESYAKSDKRIKLISTVNNGLGAARNIGMAHATGDYIVFADSDDVVPRKAYRVMIETLRSSNSEFVIGSYTRLTETREHMPQWLQRVHTEARIHIKADEYLDGLINVFAWNKMFKREFLERIDFSWPEGIRYEDQYPVTRAMILAEAFDVIPDVVFKYRVRFDGTSITQNKQDFADVDDRYSVIKSTKDMVYELGSPEFRAHWAAKVLSFDLLPYMKESRLADLKYHEKVVELVDLVVEGAGADVMAMVPVKERTAIFAFRHLPREELGKVLLENSELGFHVPFVEREGDFYFAPEYLQSLSITPHDDVLRFEEIDLPLVRNLNRIYWDDENLVFEGWAFPKSIGVHPGAEPLRVYLRNMTNASEVDLAVSPSSDYVSRAVKSKWTNFDNTAFVATLDTAKIRDIPSLTQSSSQWQLRAQLKLGNRSWDEHFPTVTGNGSAGRREAEAFADGTWVSPVKTKGNGIAVNVKRIHAWTAGPIDSAGGKSVVEVASDLAGKPNYRLDKRANASTGNVDSGARSSVSLDKVEISDAKGVKLRKSGKGEILTLQVGRSRSSVNVTNASVPSRFERIESGVLQRNIHSEAQIVTDRPVGFVTSLELSGTTLRLRGTLANAKSSSLTVSLRSRLHEFSAWCNLDEVGRFEVSLDLTYDLYGSLRNARPGRYYLRLKTGDSDIRVLADRAMANAFPIDVPGTSFRLRAVKTINGFVRFDLSTPSSENETGAFNQQRLQDWHRNADVEPIPDSVFFQSYLGEEATDSARAIHEELHSRFPEMQLFWGVKDSSVPLPDGGIPVVRGTEDWYDKLTRSQFLVNNIYFPVWFKKRSFQTYLQTWHGTPLKKIGRSYWEDRRRSPDWIERMEQEAKSWDYLISPNPFCSDLFPSEFAYTGTLLESGYPRNDALANPEPEVIASTKSKIGIDSSKKVVLYAPTWRDQKAPKSWQAEMVDFLDLSRLVGDLGSDYQILVRGHGHNARAGSVVESQDGVIDVTFYPQINDLYLVSDLVITDYSSVMFDFAVTGRPMIFYAPDLDSYAEGIRGFYMDYKSLVPGPIFEDQDGLAESIRQMTSETAEADSRLADFVATYCPWDDGNAAKRVVDEVWKGR